MEVVHGVLLPSRLLLYGYYVARIVYLAIVTIMLFSSGLPGYLDGDEVVSIVIF